MAATTTYVETSDFPTTPRPLTGNIGETMDNADGFSGNIIATADSSTYEAADYDTGGLRYYMGTLWLGGITNPSNQTVNLIITTNDTDIALFECTPSAGSAPTNIIFDGSNDSISMAPEVILSGASGEVMDLSKTGIYQYTGSSTAPLENAYVIIHGTGTGNDTFTGSASTNVLYEGTGNSNFYQSAGNDLISCSGGSSIYHANDVWANYEGGYQDQSGNNFLNNGEDWLFRDHGTGKIIDVDERTHGNNQRCDILIFK
ncbi:hypothetical protein [Acetobacter sp.]|uniref:hypothetical protein n=1 Tax=Acetobacter sp. TaxID=440 RepID=UPI0039ECF2E8